MATEKQLGEVLEKIQGDANGFIAASLVDLDSGMTLAVRSVRSDFDLTAASAYNSELVKQKLRIMKTLNLNSTIEDMLISLSDQIHLIKLVGPNTFLYLAVDKKQSNLAIVRSAVAKHLSILG
jgi:predicted regulator of Ras-like GTPase activity (Roadblock/LC7/MglB family)